MKQLVTFLALFLMSFLTQAQDSLELTTYLDKYNLEIEEGDNEALYKEACYWEAIPYLYAGKSQSGIDCSGFSKHIYSKVFNNKLSGSSRDLYKQAVPVEKEQLQEGDMVFFKIGNRSNISHVGIYLKEGKFVHASSSKGITVSSLEENYYKKYFFSGGRIITDTTD